MNQRHVGVVALVVSAALLYGASPAVAQSTGAASSFAIAGAAGVTHAGGAGTVIGGDVGSSPSASITGFPPALITPPFGLHANDAAAIAAQAADVALFTALGAGACTDTRAAQMSGASFGPGIHCFTATADLAATGTMTLAGNGLYIFRVGSALTANVNSTVVFAGVDPCNVFWQVTSAATLNGANFVGNVVAQAGVTVGSGARLTGRALATVGPVTLAGTNTIGGCSAAAAAPTGPDLVIVKTHALPFAVGANAVYSIALSNRGGVATSGSYSVTDTLPAGLTFVSATGTGWVCSAAGQIVTCTSSTVVAAQSTSPNAISITVMPGAAAVPSVTNTAVVAGGGDTDLTNNTTTDVTPVAVPVPTLSQWAMIALTILLVFAGVTAIRRQHV